MTGSKLPLWLLAVVVVSGCTPYRPEPLDVALCEAEPAVCARLCAGCADFEGCLSAGGECQAAANDFWIDDATDGGDDIWKAGCHYSYSDNACSLNKQWHMGDLCGDNNPDQIIEWTNAKCHGPQGDTSIYDCDKECKKKGLGGGTCKVISDACGKGRDSARCECMANPS